jgi:hypothetical protein
MLGRLVETLKNHTSIGQLKSNYINEFLIYKPERMMSSKKLEVSLDNGNEHLILSWEKWRQRSLYQPQEETTLMSNEDLQLEIAPQIVYLVANKQYPINHKDIIISQENSDKFKIRINGINNIIMYLLLNRRLRARMPFNTEGALYDMREIRALAQLIAAGKIPAKQVSFRPQVIEKTNSLHQLNLALIKHNIVVLSLIKFSTSTEELGKRVVLAYGEPYIRHEFAKKNKILPFVKQAICDGYIKEVYKLFYTDMFTACMSIYWRLRSNDNKTMFQYLSGIACETICLIAAEDENHHRTSDIPYIEDARHFRQLIEERKLQFLIDENELKEAINLLDNSSVLKNKGQHYYTIAGKIQIPPDNDAEYNAYKNLAKTLKKAFQEGADDLRVKLFDQYITASQLDSFFKWQRSHKKNNNEEQIADTETDPQLLNSIYRVALFISKQKDDITLSNKALDCLGQAAYDNLYMGRAFLYWNKAKPTYLSGKNLEKYAHLLMGKNEPSWKCLPYLLEAYSRTLNEDTYRLAALTIKFGSKTEINSLKTQETPDIISKYWTDLRKPENRQQGKYYLRLFPRKKIAYPFIAEEIRIEDKATRNDKKIREKTIFHIKKAIKQLCQKITSTNKGWFAFFYKTDNASRRQLIALLKQLKAELRTSKQPLPTILNDFFHANLEILSSPGNKDLCQLKQLTTLKAYALQVQAQCMCNIHQTQNPYQIGCQ